MFDCEKKNYNAYKPHVARVFLLVMDHCITDTLAGSVVPQPFSWRRKPVSQLVVLCRTYVVHNYVLDAFRVCCQSAGIPTLFFEDLFIVPAAVCGSIGPLVTLALTTKAFPQSMWFLGIFCRIFHESKPFRLYS